MCAVFLLSILAFSSSRKSLSPTSIFIIVFSFCLDDESKLVSSGCVFLVHRLQCHRRHGHKYFHVLLHCALLFKHFCNLTKSSFISGLLLPPATLPSNYESILFGHTHKSSICHETSCTCSNSAHHVIVVESEILGLSEDLLCHGLHSSTIEANTCHSKNRSILLKYVSWVKN